VTFDQLLQLSNQFRFGHASCIFYSCPVIMAEGRLTFKDLRRFPAAGARNVVP
jgi:hypothetical protein